MTEPRAFMGVKARKARPAPPAPAAPIEWPRADPAALAAFDPSSRVCTMNCGPHGLDPRTRAEQLFLCDDCDQKEPAPMTDTTATPKAATPSACKHCGSTDLAWQTSNVSRCGVQNGRLRLSEVECQFVFGCNHCSETLAVLSADRVAGMMNAAQD